MGAINEKLRLADGRAPVGFGHCPAVAPGAGQRGPKRHEVHPSVIFQILPPFVKTNLTLSAKKV